MADRRCAVLEIETQFFVDAFKFLNETHCPYQVIGNALPDDAKVVHVWHSQFPDCINLMLESESFAPILEGSNAPKLKPPVIKMIYPVAEEG